MNTKTILVVDDDYSILNFLKIYFELAGYSVVTATDGVEGISVFLQHQSSISLLLTDVMMPNMNGFDLADRVLEVDSKLPVLFMSGSAENISRGFGCVAKPFDGDELIGRVGNILSSPPATGMQSMTAVR